MSKAKSFISKQLSTATVNQVQAVNGISTLAYELDVNKPDIKTNPIPGLFVMETFLNFDSLFNLTAFKPSIANLLNLLQLNATNRSVNLSASDLSNLLSLGGAVYAYYRGVYGLQQAMEMGIECTWPDVTLEVVRDCVTQLRQVVQRVPVLPKLAQLINRTFGVAGVQDPHGTTTVVIPTSIHVIEQELNWDNAETGLTDKKLIVAANFFRDYAASTLPELADELTLFAGTVANCFPNLDDVQITMADIKHVFMNASAVTDQTTLPRWGMTMAQLAKFDSDHPVILYAPRGDERLPDELLLTCPLPLRSVANTYAVYAPCVMIKYVSRVVTNPETAEVSVAQFDGLINTLEAVYNYSQLSGYGYFPATLLKMGIGEEVMIHQPEYTDPNYVDFRGLYTIMNALFLDIATPPLLEKFDRYVLQNKAKQNFKQK